MAGWKTATGQSVEVGIHGISSDGELRNVMSLHYKSSHLLFSLPVHIDTF